MWYNCHDIKSVLLSSMYTNVVLLAILLFHSLKDLEMKEHCTLYGCDRNQRYLPIHHSPEKMREALTLRRFHAFIGWDGVSAFRHKALHSAWKRWKAYEEVTIVFIATCSPLPALHIDVGQLLERFVVILYCGAAFEFGLLTHITQIPLWEQNDLTCL